MGIITNSLRCSNRYFLLGIEGICANFRPPFSQLDTSLPVSFADLKRINSRSLCFERAEHVAILDQLHSNHGIRNDSDDSAETCDL